jgi:hypothetical protein
MALVRTDISVSIIRFESITELGPTLQELVTEHTAKNHCGLIYKGIFSDIQPLLSPTKKNGVGRMEAATHIVCFSC